MQLFIPEKINFILNTLKNNQYDAFLVGGCVRDMLLGKTPHDFDITTSAKPHEVEKLFEHTVSTGIKHGTVTVIIDKTPVEVTTFRTEGEYSDCRRPDNVEFVTDIKYDLSRRDFTVNAMAYNQTDGLIDLFGGRNDLENKTLKAVGNPEKRFCEDALRILRLYRFASVLDFKIEPETQQATNRCIKLLSLVSRERVFSELTRAVMGKNTKILNSFISSGGLEFLNITRCDDLSALAALPQNGNLRLFAFLYFCHCDIDYVLKELRASNLQKNYCKALKTLNESKVPSKKSEIKATLRLFGKQVLLDFLSFKAIVFGFDAKNTLLLIEEIISNNEPYLLSDLAIGGNELKKLGLSGKEIKSALENLLYAVCEEPSLNTKEKLTEIILKDR